MADTTSPSAGEQSAVRCFLSYSHADDEILNFAGAFKKHLEAFCFADRGRRVEIFLDRESIGWGTEWRQQITDSIRGALAFIPVITRTYFERPACREEILAFYNSAESLGVTELLLPVVIMGQSYINGSDDPVARIIAERQYYDLQEAALEGAQTPTWRRSMLDLSNKLVDAVESAEQALSTTRHSVITTAEAEVSSSAYDPEQKEDPPGLHEIMDEFENSVNQMNRAGGEMLQTLYRFTDAISTGEQKLQTGTVQERRAKVHEVAREIGPICEQLGRLGREWESATSKADSSIRPYHSIVSDYGSSDMKARFRNDLESLTRELEILDTTERDLVGFLDSLRPIEVMSSPMRAPLRPARSGMNSVQSSLEMVRSWRELTI